MGALALCTMWSKFCGCLTFAHIAFYISFCQRLNMFEVRLVEADIRVCDVGLIHRVTPRFKAMLQEIYAIGNCSHKFFYIFAPIEFLYTLQVKPLMFKGSGLGDANSLVLLACRS